MIKKYKRFHESKRTQNLETIANEFECRIEKVGKLERLFFRPGEIDINNLISFFNSIEQLGECYWWSEGKDFVFEFEAINSINK